MLGARAHRSSGRIRQAAAPAGLAEAAGAFGPERNRLSAGQARAALARLPGWRLTRRARALALGGKLTPGPLQAAEAAAVLLSLPPGFAFEARFEPGRFELAIWDAVAGGVSPAALHIARRLARLPTHRMGLASPPRLSERTLRMIDSVLAYQQQLQALARQLRAEIPRLRDAQQGILALLPSAEEQEALLETGQLPFPFSLWVDTDLIVHQLCGSIAQLEAASEASQECPSVPCRDSSELQSEIDPGFRAGPKA